MVTVPPTIILAIYPFQSQSTPNSPTPFNSFWNIHVLYNLTPNTTYITHRNLEFTWLFILSSRHSVDILTKIISIQFSLHPLHSFMFLAWWLLLKTVMWCHLFRVFIYIYSLLIEKDLCECWKISVKFACSLFYAFL
jgi:hypothetical protein